MAFIRGYKGEKDFITKLKHSISGIPRPKKFRNTADFLPVFISRVTATVRKKIENQWAKAISEGKEVTVNIDIKYDGDGFRPIEFNVEYTIDGDFFSQSILN